MSKNWQSEIALGEDSRRQFKETVRNADSLAAEMAAFANTNGGTIYIGVADGGKAVGLAREDVSRVNQLISNAASQHIRSPLAVQTENVALDDGQVVIILSVPKGIDKPYFDNKGVIWLKAGADKRKLKSKEELRRIFQFNDQFHADELPTKAGIDKLDKLRFRDFLRDEHGLAYPDTDAELTRLLQNLNLATDAGVLNLAGVLLFAEQPELIKPQFVVKAIRYPGNEIHANRYIDTEDVAGPLPKLYADAYAFVMRNLHKVQAGRGVNAPGQAEIPAAVVEELLVNALVHRDYLVSAPIRLFIFDDRLEIISPGHLPNNLTVEKIRAGNSNIRNPILVSYAAKGLLPYHGLGSGIKRALAVWPRIDFTNDEDGCLFSTTVHRTPVDELDIIERAPGVSGKRADTTRDHGNNARLEGQDAPLSEAGSPLEGQNGPSIGVDTQEPSGTTQEPSGTTQEPSGTTQEPSGTTQEPEASTRELILDMLRREPSITRRELAERLELSGDGVKYHLNKLRKAGRIRHVGATKSGHWEVLR